MDSRDTSVLVNRQLMGRFSNRLHTPMLEPGLCQSCLGVVNPVYPLCYRCRMDAVATVSESLGVCTFAEKKSQAYRDMRLYKSRWTSTGKRPAEDLILCLLWNALVAHAQCYSSIDAWTVTPSLRPSEETSSTSHPLAVLVNRLGVSAYIGSEVAMVGQLQGSHAREVDPSNFTLRDPSVVAGKSVLLVDDSYVSGGHLKSALGALREAGAARVQALVVARVLEPTYMPDVLQSLQCLQAPYSPQDCPWQHERTCSSQ